MGQVKDHGSQIRGSGVFVILTVSIGCLPIRQVTNTNADEFQIYSAIIDSLVLEYDIDKSNFSLLDSTISPHFFNIYGTLPRFDLTMYNTEFETYLLNYKSKSIIDFIKFYDIGTYNQSNANISFSNIFVTKDEKFAIVYVAVNHGNMSLFGSGRFLLLEKNNRWRIVWGRYVWKG